MVVKEDNAHFAPVQSLDRMCIVVNSLFYCEDDNYDFQTCLHLISLKVHLVLVKSPAKPDRHTRVSCGPQLVLLCR